MNDTLPECLTQLAQSMESLRPAGAPPAWAEILGPLAHPERARWHPYLETMVGFVAPPTCDAIATVGYGWARGMGGPPAGEEVLQPGERRRCRVVFLMTRSGEMTGYLRDGTTILDNGPPTVGRVPDCVRRCFGLPTPPPDESTDVLLADIWLSNVLGWAQQAPRRPDWIVVAHLHPVIEVAAANGVFVPPSKFRRIMQVGAEVWTWGYLAEQAASPGWISDLLPAGAGGWMDEGILSRWLLDSVTRVDRLLELVTPLIEPAATVKLRATLKQLGILGRPPRNPRAARASNT